ncbi:MAG: MmgE/PrpD family protein [Eubacterium sp.]|nr:MmgE/PrpD family protein [Eubacterium sp.]
MKQLRNLARFVSELKLENVPEEAVAAAKACLLDTVAAAKGAADNQMYQGIKKVYLDHEGCGKISASIWSSSEKAPIRTAAFINAMAGHTLELDDVHTGSKTHIGTVVVPAAWAAAEAVSSSGKQLLEAVICGYEVMARIGMGFGVSGHRNKGWHVTGTAGTFGAAAACAKLFGFDEEQIVSAFGLAGMQSCTTWAFLTGSATDKVMHPARAAASGIESCLLVQGGMTGTSHILDAEDGGIFPMMSDSWDYDKVDAGLNQVWEILNVDKKPYPCCRSVHGSIDAAIMLKERFGISAEDIDHVDIDTYLVGLKQCGLSEGSVHPTVPTEAKFSTPYVSATALLEGNVGLSDFLPENINDPVRQDLLSRIHVHESDVFTAKYPDHWGCCMNITMKNGEVYSQYIEDASGSVSQPLDEAQLQRKAASCLEGMPEKKFMQLVNEIRTIDSAASLPDISC